MTSDEAIARARDALADDAGVATAVLVERLDGRPPYWLVTIDDEQRTLAVAAIGQDGEIVGAGRPSAPGRHLATDAARARHLAGAASDAGVRLVWFASRASMSPLFPLWQVDRSDGSQAWVSSDGRVFDKRPQSGRGG